MTEDERRRAFAEAFIAQARSDWKIYRLLASRDLPACHALHQLQMTCEKLAKAYRLRDTRSPVEVLVATHAGFTKFIGPFVLATMKDEYKGRAAQLAVVMRQARVLAEQIEKLAPAIDRAVSPANAEYPWELADQVVAPCTYGFPSLHLMREAGGRAFLNLIARALADFERVAVV